MFAYFTFCPSFARLPQFIEVLFHIAQIKRQTLGVNFPFFRLCFPLLVAICVALSTTLYRLDTGVACVSLLIIIQTASRNYAQITHLLIHLLHRLTNSQSVKNDDKLRTEYDA